MGLMRVKKLRVHPLVFVTMYLLAIPIFAAIYCFIPNGFYSPYARFEPDGKRDVYEAGKTIEAAIRSNLLNNPMGSNIKGNIVRITDDTAVQRVHANDNGSISFDVNVMFKYADGRGILQIPIGVATDERSFIFIGGPDGTYRYFLLVNMFQTILPSTINEVYKEAFAALFHASDFDNAPMLELTKNQYERLSAFFDGMDGDAVSVSGAYWRMLYFSVATITTLGFGDIVPISAAARVVVSIETVVGTVIFGFFMNAVASRAGKGNRSVPVTLH